MSEIVKINHEQLGSLSILIENDSDPLFNLEDVARNLGYTKTAKGKQYIRKERIAAIIEKQDIKTVVRDGQLYVTESGFYDFVLESETKVAKQYRKWVTDEVLPSIRKNGSYQKEIVPLTESEKRLQMLQIMSEQEKNLTELDKRVSKVEDSVRIDAGKQYILNKAIKSRVYKVHETMEDTCERKKLFSKIHRNFKEAFRVASYRDIRKLDFDDAMNWVSSWRPLN